MQAGFEIVRASIDGARLTASFLRRRLQGRPQQPSHLLQTLDSAFKVRDLMQPFAEPLEAIGTDRQ